jgi:hypothetical protein
MQEPDEPNMFEIGLALRYPRNARPSAEVAGSIRTRPAASDGAGTGPAGLWGPPVTGELAMALSIHGFSTRVLYTAQNSQSDATLTGNGFVNGQTTVTVYDPYSNTTNPTYKWTGTLQQVNGQWQVTLTEQLPAPGGVGDNPAQVGVTVDDGSGESPVFGPVNVNTAS